MNTYKPIIAITMGDPGGIGPEIILKVFKNHNMYEKSFPIVIGDKRILEFYKNLYLYDVKLVPFSEVEEILENKENFSSKDIPILNMENVNLEEFVPSKILKTSGKASYEYIEKAIELALAGKVNANVTAPICKAALNIAGYDYPGHTEIYAQKTGVKRYLMTLFTDTIKVAHLTCHVALKDIFKYITEDNIMWAVELLHTTMKKMGIKKPCIGVCALNPHASENGLFGEEEKKIIIPAIEKLKKKKINVSGPFSADTIFAKAKYGKFDIILAMYHDQGHIAVKTLYYKKEKGGYSFEGVNITLGLPIIRTSVDHGTAFDIVGKNIASEKSLIDAYNLAVKLAQK